VKDSLTVGTAPVAVPVVEVVEGAVVES